MWSTEREHTCTSDYTLFLLRLACDRRMSSPRPRRTSHCLQERDFTLVFRTFGSDIAEVVDEINMFATGQHPAYPEVSSPHGVL